MDKTTLKAVLFDFDSTLIDRSREYQSWPDFTKPHLEKVFARIQKSYPDLTWDDFYLEIEQVREKMWADRVYSPHVGKLLTLSLERLGVSHNNIDEQDLLLAYDWKPVEGIVPFPDAIEVLESLYTYKIKTGIITNSSEPMWMRDIELKKFGLLSYFPECRIASADVGYLKPHPKIFQVALSCLNIVPDQAVFVGDHYETDILGAKGIGMRAVLRLGTMIANKVEGTIKPDGIINDLSELLPLLDRWYPNWRK